MRLLRRTLSACIKVERRGGADVRPVELDPVQLRTTIIALALDAHDAMPESGRLRLEVETVEIGDDWVAIDTQVAPGRYVRLSVGDTGNGVTKDQPSRAGAVPHREGALEGHRAGAVRGPGLRAPVGRGAHALRPALAGYGGPAPLPRGFRYGPPRTRRDRVDRGLRRGPRRAGGRGRTGRAAALRGPCRLPGRRDDRAGRRAGGLGHPDRTRRCRPRLQRPDRARGDDRRGPRRAW